MTVAVAEVVVAEEEVVVVAVVGALSAAVCELEVELCQLAPLYRGT